MALLKRSLHLLPNTDSSIDSRYPDGTKPQVQPSSLGINQAAFAAANINLTGLSQGTVYTFDYRQYLTGTSAGTATLTVNAISGTLAGWAIAANGNGPTNPGTNPANGALQVIANDNAGTIVSFPIQPWSVIAVSQTLKKKWRPGHGAGFGTTYFGGSTATSTPTIPSGVKNEMEATRPYALVLRYLPSVTWSALEPIKGETDVTATYPNGYATGAAVIRALCDYMGAMGKDCVIKLQLGGFTSTHAGATDYSIVPKYVQTDSAYGAAGYRVNPTVALSAAPAAGATSASLSSNWAYPSGTYTASFSNSDSRTVTLTQGATGISWSGGLSSAATTKVIISRFVVNLPSQHGFWGGDGNGNTYGACIHRPAIMNRIIQMVNVLGGYFDNLVTFYGWNIDENSFIAGASSANGCPDFSNNAADVQFKAYIAQCVGTFKKSHFLIENSYWNNATFNQSFTDFLMKAGAVQSNTDVMGLTYSNAHSGNPLSWGMAQYCGFSGGGTAPTFNYRDAGYPLMTEIQGTDMGAYGQFAGGYTKEDILAELNQVLKATHTFWAVMLQAEGTVPKLRPQSVWSFMGPFLNNPANALTNKTYPTISPGYT